MKRQTLFLVILSIVYLTGCGVKSRSTSVPSGTPAGDPGTPSIPSDPSTPTSPTTPEGTPQGGINTNLPQIFSVSSGEGRLTSSRFRAVGSVGSTQATSAQSAHFKYESPLKKQASTRLTTENTNE